MSSLAHTPTLQGRSFPTHDQSLRKRAYSQTFSSPPDAFNKSVTGNGRSYAYLSMSYRLLWMANNGGHWQYWHVDSEACYIDVAGGGESVLGEENGPRELLGPSSPAAGGKGQMEAWHECIHHQLTLILASSAFRNSKRYSALLKYLVERTLEGQAEELKERNIGVDVFDRTPDYDTAADHVVRSAGSEIRKRLAQYYAEPGQEAAIRIDVFPGSYVPQFRPCGEEPRVTPNREYPEGPGLKTEDVRPQSSRNLGRWLVLFAAFFAGAVLALGVTLLVSRRPQTALDRFWAPLISQRGTMLLCVGYLRSVGTDVPQVPGSGLPAGSPTNFMADPGVLRLHVAGEDAIALARIAGVLEGAGKSYRSHRTLSHLRRSSAGPRGVDRRKQPLGSPDDPYTAFPT